MRKLFALGVGVAVMVVVAGLAPESLGRADSAGVKRVARTTAVELTSAQHDCELFLPVNVTASFYAADPHLSVRIDNGNARRDVVIQLSAEGATTARGTTVGVRYSIDGGSFDVHGPELFFSEPNFETHTNISIVTLGPGFHTIVPGYVIWPGQGKGQVLFRCLSVEAGVR